MRDFFAGALSAIVVLAVGAFGYIGLGFAAVGADAKPGVWEAGFMRSAVHASVRREARGLQNPLVPTDATLIAGGKLYLADCAGCHGAPGGSSSKFPTTFYPEVPQLSLGGTQYSEAEVFWVAKHGIRRTGMFPQGPYYTNSELWSLSAFITRIKNLSPSVLYSIQQQAK